MKFSAILLVICFLAAVFAENVQSAPAPAAVSVEQLAPFKTLQASVTKMNTDFTKVSSQMASLRASVEALQKENAQLKSSLSGMKTTNDDVATLRAQIQELKTLAANSSFISTVNAYVETAKVTATKYYKIAVVKAGPAMQQAKVHINKQYVLAKPYIAKASVSAQAAFDKAVAYYKETLPIARAKTTLLLTQAGLPQEHVPAAATATVSVVLVLAASMILAILKMILSFLCCCGGRKKKVVKK
jgi:septal ring factor EnvC (AmiA/AmiB activator)